MVQLFLFTSEDILKTVKRESSYLGERRLSEDGTPLLDDIVYDEEYIIQFRDHFLDARGKVIGATLAYGKTIDVDADFFEVNNLDDEKDFALFLEFPETFAKGMIVPITSKIKEFLVAYIMYRWLETKLPREAATYLDRSETYLKDIKRHCEMRITPRRRTGRYY